MIKITTYSELRNFIQKFKEGYFDLLIIISEGGLGKTYNSENLLGEDICKINSHVTPLGLFQYGYKYLNNLIWFDDVESLFNNDKLVGLMKQFAQTTQVKHIRFITSRIIKSGEDEIPNEYTTSSKILMTCNSINRIKNAGIRALLDRGLIVYFMPSTKEKIDYIKKYFDKFDEEIVKNLEKKGNFSLRDYVKAFQLKSAGFKEWREMT